MAKGNDLWDDSVLIGAYEDAIWKYKAMNDLVEGEVTDGRSKETLPVPEVDGRSKEFCFKNENLQDYSTKKIISSESCENPSTEIPSSAKHVEFSCEQTRNTGPVPEVTALSDLNRNDEEAWCSSSQEEYNKLLEQYYDIDYKRQIILQQLNQYPISDPGYYQVAADPFASVSCQCSYGCQNWTVPCNSSAAPCTGADIVKRAMDAAKTALCSLKIGTTCNSCLSENEGKENQVGTSIDVITEASVARTNLADVLNAWYSAGLHTGKYLSEQQLEKKEELNQRQ